MCEAGCLSGAIAELPNHAQFDCKQPTAGSRLEVSGADLLPGSLSQVSPRAQCSASCASGWSGCEQLAEDLNVFRQDRLRSPKERRAVVEVRQAVQSPGRHGGIL